MKVGKYLYLSQSPQLIPNDKIMIFWDTCALLDIIRIPHRDNLSLTDLENYERISNYITNEDIISVTSGLVLSEFYDHYQPEHDKLIQEQKKVKDSVKEYVQYMSSIKKINRITNAIDILNVEPRLTYVLNKILKKTFVLREQSIYRNFADYRLRNKMAPAAKKSEYKDCYIWGTFLELIHKINPTSPYLAFMTVNIKDYKENNQLHPHILTDCHLPSMKVIFNIGALYRDISNSLGF